MKIAVVIGHNEKNKGAYSNLLKTSEFTYNSELAKLLPFYIYFENATITSYTKRMQELASRINKSNFDLVVGLHINALNGVAEGCECLYYKNSVYGKRWAEIISEKVAKEYGTKNRGAKERIEQDRGGAFLKYINAPTVIYEPFFGDNKESLLFKDINKHAKILIDILC